VLPEGTTALRALEGIRRHPIPLAVIVDEYGGVEGLVTANDLLAAIAGDLMDTRDAGYGAQQREDGGWLVDASMSMEDLERATGISLSRNTAYVTVSGLILHELGKIPHVGDSVESGDWRLEVLTIEHRRVGKALLRRL